MNIKPAKGKKGFILEINDKFVFRIYHGNGKFTDYEIRANDFEVEIVDDFTELYESEDGNRIDYSRRLLALNEDGSKKEI